MKDSDRIDAISTASSIAKARRLVADSPTGFELALFDEVRHALGRDPQRAKSLAKAGEALDSKRSCWGHRFRAVRHRLDQKWLASANEFLRAESACRDTVEGAAMAVGAIDSLARAGRVSRAVKEGDRIIELLLKAGRTSDAGRAALNLGNALLWHDRVEDAIPILERAVTFLDGSGIEQASAWLGLSTANIDNGTSIEVRAQAERAKASFEALGLGHFAAISEQNIAYADLMCGRLDDALDRLLGLKSSFPRDGEEHARNEQHLGETYLRLNMPVEARQAFRDALATRAMGRLPFNQGLCHLGIAQAEFALDRLGEGEQSAGRALAIFKRVGNRACATLAQAASAQCAGRFDQAELARLADELEAHCFRRKTAEILFLLSELSEDAATLERGSRIVEDYGLVDLQWRMHAASARIATPDRRLDSYREMAASMWETRAIHRSTVARQHFLRDKDHALREYLGVLLDDPHEKNVEEALQVLSDARSISLIDEITFARGDTLGSEQGARLQAVREELREALDTEVPRDGTRRTKAQDVQRWRRAWHEASVPLLALARDQVNAVADLTYVQTNGRYYKITGSRTAGLADRATIDEATKWLSFDLQEPLVVPNLSATRIHSQAEVYASMLGFEPSADQLTVMPDEALWRAPWPVLAMATSPSTEVVVCLAPAFQSTYAPTRPPKSATVWYQESCLLPHIRREVDAIVEMFPDARLCGSAQEVRASLLGGDTDILHIATHAAMNAWNPMFSYLQFDDGAVFAAEIARGGLRPRLVTMSACDSGSISSIESNEPDGLVRAALSLGSDAVVASAWPLDDRASSIFTLPYYSVLRGGGGVLESMRAGRSAVRAQFEHPYYWGGMVVFGGYLRQ